ncbi:hypothetical protein PV327_005195 [Microctonus hyperodae]|uniref:Mutator-like transposase domain-containing protein n=1 Tax=Microctonus hyperodae TaxID=165561 RepID=A0AA39G172_MICHY|nr:hypothetical protein PV327_005195 [Microctonus hyperodae]
MDKIKKRFHWKGKVVSEKVYNLRLKQQKLGQKLKRRRVFNPYEFGKQMFCKLCENLLSILVVTHEEEVALGSILHISCQKCNFSNKITTDKQHYTPSFGFTQLNKFLAAMNLSTMSWDIFKSTQKEITPVIEKMTYASCSKATEEEKTLTISNPEELRKLL